MTQRSWSNKKPKPQKSYSPDMSKHPRLPQANQTSMFRQTSSYPSLQIKLQFMKSDAKPNTKLTALQLLTRCLDLEAFLKRLWLRTTNSFCLMMKSNPSCKFCVEKHLKFQGWRSFRKKSWEKWRSNSKTLQAWWTTTRVKSKRWKNRNRNGWKLTKIRRT